MLKFSKFKQNILASGTIGIERLRVIVNIEKICCHNQESNKEFWTKIA